VYFHKQERRRPGNPFRCLLLFSCHEYNPDIGRGKYGEQAIADSDLIYSVRNASAGEIRLARNAGMSDATSADKPSVRTATRITTGSYGFSP
jgi:hypothetical protein